MDAHKQSNRRFTIAGIACSFVTLTFLTLMTRLGGSCQTRYNTAPPFIEKSSLTIHESNVRPNEELNLEVDGLLNKIKGISEKIQQLKNKIRHKDDKPSKQGDSSTDTGWDHNWDKMDNINRTSLHSTYVNLVVRGESKDGQLTTSGIQQMAQVADYLRDIYKQHTLKVIHGEDYVSKNSAIEITRTTHGVISQDSLLHGGYPGFPDPLVNETVLPSMEIRSYLEFRDSARLEAGFRRYIHHGEKMEHGIVLVAPEVVVKYYILRSLQLPVTMWQRLSLAHGSISTISVAVNNDVFVPNIGCIGHLRS